MAEDDGQPRRINLCETCSDLRRAERNESTVIDAVRKAMIEQKCLSRQTVGRFGVRRFHKHDVGAIHDQRGVGKGFVGRSNKSGAVGDNHMCDKRCNERSFNFFCELAVTVAEAGGLRHTMNFERAEAAQHLQLEPRAPSRKRRCLRTTRLQAGGTSSRCKKLLSMSIMTFLR